MENHVLSDILISHTKMENLPCHILSDILIWLPVRSVGQMRCVSKPWNAILSQPSFIRSHVNLHRQIPNNDDEGFLVISLGSNFHPFSLTPAPFSQSPKSIKLPMDTAFADIKFIGSVNGLICVCFLSALYTNIVIKISNPSVSAVSTLPTCDLPGLMHLRFGFDPKTDDYKLVKLMHRYEPPQNKVQLERDNFVVEENGLQVEVYSMKKGSWKLINDSNFPMHISMVSDDDKACVDGHDGHLHWLGYTCINGAMELKTIVAFDLSLETFSEISLPHSVVKEDWSYNLTVLDGKLCVTMSCYEGYEIWVMNEYGVAESWVKQDFLLNPDTGIKGVRPVMNEYCAAESWVIQHFISNPDTIKDLIPVMNEYGAAESWVKQHFLSNPDTCIKGLIPVGFTLTNKCVCSFLRDDNLFLYDQISGKCKSFGVFSWDYVKVVQYVESLDWVAP